MPSTLRNSEVVCLELADAKAASNELTREIEEALQDGVVDAREIAAILHRKRVLDKELQEALVIAAEADYIEAEYEFKKRHRLGAEPHQYLRARLHDVSSMSSANGHSANGKARVEAGQLTEAGKG